MHKKILSVCIIALAVLAAASAGCTGTQPSAATPTPTPAPATTAVTENPTAAPTAAVVEKTVYIVGIGHEHPPYFYFDKEGNAHGFTVDGAKWVAEDGDFELEFMKSAWDEIIPALLAKTIDIAISDMTINPESAAKAVSPDVYWLTGQDIVVKNGSTITLDDVKTGKAKIATQKGSTADTWIRTDLIEPGILDESKLVLYDSFAPALADLEKGTVDAAIYYKPLVRKAIEGRNVDIIGTIDTEEFFGLAIRNGDTELLEKINAGHMNLQNHTRWDELIEKHEIL